MSAGLIAISLGAVLCIVGYRRGLTLKSRLAPWAKDILDGGGSVTGFGEHGQGTALMVNRLLFGLGVVLMVVGLWMATVG